MRVGWNNVHFAIDYALAALPASHPIAQQIGAEFAALVPPMTINYTGYTPITDRAFIVGNLSLMFDGTGSIAQLIDTSTGISYADMTHTLGSFRYDSYTLDDYDIFFGEYNENGDWHASWIQIDFGKLWLNETYASRITAYPNMTQTLLSEHQ